MAFNWQQALAGAAGGGLSGAGTGAAFGPAAPATIPISALIGALLGGLSGGFGGGEEAGFKQAPQTPQQTRLQELLAQLGEQNLQNPYGGFEGMRQNALSDFFQYIVPGLQERFTGGQRGENSYTSGALKSQLSGSGASLAERLNAMRENYGQNRQSLGMNQIQSALNPQQYYQQRQPGLGENLLTGSIQAAPAAIQGYQQNQQLTKILEALNQAK